jgi:glycosyltransferase involved in cell wall biosynthesis
MSASKRVSAIITNYNHGEFLYEAVLGLVKQTRRPDEIVVVDDASTDHSRDVLALLQREHPEIIVILHEKNAGVNVAVKTAIDRSTGDYLTTLGADDPLNPQFFEKALSVHAANPGIGICSGEYHLKYVGCGLTYPMTVGLADRPRAFTTEQMINIYRARTHLSVATAPAIWRRTAWENVGGMRPELGWLSDWFAALVTISRHGFGYVPGHMQTRRQEPESYSSAGIQQHKAHIALLNEVLETLETPAYADAQSFFKIHSVLSRFGFKALHTLVQDRRFYKYLSLDLLLAAIRVETVPFTSNTSHLKNMRPEAFAELTKTILAAYSDSLLELALQRKSQGRYTEAIDLCLKARDAFPDKPAPMTLADEITRLIRHNENALMLRNAQRLTA